MNSTDGLNVNILKELEVKISEHIRCKVELCSIKI